MLARAVTRLGECGCRIQKIRRETRQIFRRLQPEHEVAFVLQNVLRELRAQCCQPRGDFGQARALRIIEFGAGADKRLLHPLGETLLLVIQGGPFGGLHHRFNAGEHFGIEKNLGPMACQNR